MCFHSGKPFWFCCLKKKFQANLFISRYDLWATTVNVSSWIYFRFLYPCGLFWQRPSHNLYSYQFQNYESGRCTPLCISQHHLYCALIISSPFAHMLEFYILSYRFRYSMLLPCPLHGSNNYYHLYNLDGTSKDMLLTLKWHKAKFQE